MLSPANILRGVTGNLLTLSSFQKHFPTINAQEAGISAAEASARSTYQGITVASYNVGCFFGECDCFGSISIANLVKAPLHASGLEILSVDVEQSSSERPL